MTATFAAPVTGLLASGCPPAIAGLVVAVSVDAVEGQPVWSETHIGEEVVKRLPSLTDSDATSAVLSPSLIAGSCAAVLHRLPREVGRTAPFPAACGVPVAVFGPELQPWRDRVAVLKPTAVVRLAPRPRMATSGAAFDRALGGNLELHQGSFLVSRLGWLPPRRGFLVSILPHLAYLFDVWLNAKTGKGIWGAWQL